MRGFVNAKDNIIMNIKYNLKPFLSHSILAKYHVHLNILDLVTNYMIM